MLNAPFVSYIFYIKILKVLVIVAAKKKKLVTRRAVNFQIGYFSAMSSQHECFDGYVIYHPSPTLHALVQIQATESLNEKMVVILFFSIFII